MGYMPLIDLFISFQLQLTMKDLDYEKSGKEEKMDLERKGKYQITAGSTEEDLVHIHITKEK